MRGDSRDKVDAAVAEFLAPGSLVLADIRFVYSLTTRANLSMPPAQLRTCVRYLTRQRRRVTAAETRV